MIKTIITMLALVVSPILVLADTVTPEILLKNTATEVLTVIKNDKDIQNGDIHKISDIVEEKVLPHFNLERMAHISLGKNWDRASELQQVTLLEEFHKLVAHNFSLMLSQYHGQPVQYEPAHALPGSSDVTIKMLILQPDNETDEMYFRLEKSDEDWKVYDITFEGVSAVTNYRAQFNAIVQQSGIDGLIQKLIEKNKQPLSAVAAHNKKRS